MLFSQWQYLYFFPFSLSLKMSFIKSLLLIGLYVQKVFQVC